MLEQDYLAWSRQMAGLLQGERAEWAKPWLELCKACDPLAPADENRLAAIAQAYTDYLLRCKSEGLHFIQPGRFVLPGDMAGAPALQFFPWPDVAAIGESKLAQADKHTNIGMLRARFNYYCQSIVKNFYKEHFVRFDRQIVLVDCLQPLNSGGSGRHAAATFRVARQRRSASLQPAHSRADAGYSRRSRSAGAQGGWGCDRPCGRQRQIAYHAGHGA